MLPGSETCYPSLLDMAESQEAIEAALNELIFNSIATSLSSTSPYPSQHINTTFSTNSSTASHQGIPAELSFSNSTTASVLTSPPQSPCVLPSASVTTSVLTRHVQDAAYNVNTPPSHREAETVSSKRPKRMSAIKAASAFTAQLQAHYHVTEDSQTLPSQGIATDCPRVAAGRRGSQHITRPTDITPEVLDKPFSTTKRYPVNIVSEEEAMPDSKLKGYRGKKRHQLLRNMSHEDVVREETLKAERSRQSARECRRRKKAYLLMLENKVAIAESRINELEETVLKLQAQNVELQRQGQQQHLEG
eukprot:m.37122 g.37122  ORF g.37122 m.37122 type:complete len:305 (+) comp12477_c0_seq1:136-1050(+)